MKKIDVFSLRAGMVLGQPVFHPTTKYLLAGEGKVISAELINKFRALKVGFVWVDESSLTREVLDAEEGRMTEEEIFSTVSEFMGDFEMEKKQEKKNILKLRQDIENVVRETLTEVVLNKPIEIKKVNKAVDDVLSSLTKNRNLMLNLVRLRSMENYLYSHSINVCTLSLMMGMMMGATRTELSSIGVGALLHDIGMTRIPKSVYHKEDLTTDEWNQILKHTVFSFEILSGTDGVNESSKIIAYQHHERNNGSGYPKRLKAEEIDRFSKIVGLVDVYDSLISPRVYRERLSPYEAMRFILSSLREQFDENIIRTFMENLSIYPIGSLVKLNTEEIGVVCRANANMPIRPQVKLLFTKNMERIHENKVIDLKNDPKIFITSVVDPSTVDIDLIESF